MLDEATNTVTGLIGSRMDNILAKNPRKCRVVPATSVGQEKSDGNFTGAIRLLQLQKADVILTGASQYLVREHIFRVRMESQSILIHLVKTKRLISCFYLSCVLREKHTKVTYSER